MDIITYTATQKISKKIQPKLVHHWPWTQVTLPDDKITRQRHCLVNMIWNLWKIYAITPSYCITIWRNVDKNKHLLFCSYTKSRNWQNCNVNFNIIIIIIIYVLHHYECIAPLAASNLQSRWFWAILIDSVNVRLWDSRSFRTVFIHVIQGWLDGLFRSSCGNAVTIFLASALSLSNN